MFCASWICGHEETLNNVYFKTKTLSLIKASFY
jgi:hypothetical protein